MFTYSYYIYRLTGFNEVIFDCIFRIFNYCAHMFIIKKKYFLFIERIKDINLSNIKKNKFVIIYRSYKTKDSLENLISFRRECFRKKIKFYIANDLDLCITLKADGIYLSSFNKSFKPLNLLKHKFKIIGSAHNYKEIFEKMKQGCELIIFSKLFVVNYDKIPLISLS